MKWRLASLILGFVLILPTFLFGILWAASPWLSRAERGIDRRSYRMTFVEFHPAPPMFVTLAFGIVFLGLGISWSQQPSSS